MKRQDEGFGIGEDAFTPAAKDDPGQTSCAGWTIGGLLWEMPARGELAAIIKVRNGRVEVWSYRKLADTACRLARGLVKAGVKAGDPVAIIAPNGAEWIVCALALGSIGAMTVPIDDLVPDEGAAEILKDGEVKLVFSSLSHVTGLLNRACLQKKQILLLDEGDEGRYGIKSWKTLLAESPGDPSELDSGSPACLFYTSGTTGSPKGFTLSHGNIGANVRALTSERLAGPGDRALLPLPLHHAYPYVVGMLTLLQCGVAIVLPESAAGPHVFQAVQAARVTVMIGVPRLYEALLVAVVSNLVSRGALAAATFRGLLAVATWAQRAFGVPLGRWLLGPIRRRVGPALRLLVSGGARLDAEISWKLEALGWQVLAGYGLAETASIFTGNLPRKKRIGSAGTPFGEGEIRIARADQGGIGEIELYGPNITSQYRNNPAANREGFSPDGWFRTGDLGYVDRDGFLFVTGRKKEVLVLGGGKKVNPEDLEKIYEANPVIGEMAVTEQEGKLVAIVRPDTTRLQQIGTLNVDQAITVALTEVGQSRPSYERISGYSISSQPLPRTRLGKYRRFMLPSLYQQLKSGVSSRPRKEMSVSDTTLLADPIAQRVWRVILQRYGEKCPQFDSLLTLDLGVDSIEWMSLSLELQDKEGLAFAPEDIAEAATVRDLIRSLGHANRDRWSRKKSWGDRVNQDQERWLQPHGLMLNSLAFVLFVLNKMIMYTIFRLRIDGIDRLPANGPLVIAPNHFSDLDPLVVGAMLPFRLIRQTYWAGDVARLFGTRIQRAFCKVVHLYPVDERIPSSAVELASRVLSKGYVQIWFPEGWRSADRKLQRFLPGIGQLLLKSPAPIIPMYISGTFEAMPRTRRWPKPYPVHAVIGTATDAEALALLGLGKTKEDRIADGLRCRVADLARGAGESV